MVQEKLFEEKRLSYKRRLINIYKQAGDEPPSYREDQGEEEAQGDAQRDGEAVGVGEEPAGVRAGDDQLHRHCQADYGRAIDAAEF